jgi:hypothetical protein
LCCTLFGPFTKLYAILTLHLRSTYRECIICSRLNISSLDVCEVCRDAEFLAIYSSEHSDVMKTCFLCAYELTSSLNSIEVNKDSQFVADWLWSPVQETRRTSSILCMHTSSFRNMALQFKLQSNFVSAPGDALWLQRFTSESNKAHTPSHTCHLSSNILQK